MIRVTDLVWEGNFDKCLEFIHDKFFSDMETAMARSVEALTTSEEKCKQLRACHAPVLTILYYNARIDSPKPWMHGLQCRR